MNSNWPRWIKASVVDHFSSILDSNVLLVDGQRRSATQANDRYELRFNGPNISQKTRNEYRLGYTINLLIVSSSNELDIYQMERYKGLGANAFSVSIPVYKYGPDPDDDQSMVGCLNLKSDLTIRDFGYGTETVYTIAIDAYYVFELLDSVSVYSEALILALEPNLEAT